MNQNANAAQIWREFRWSENAFRYHGDLLLALMDRLKNVKPAIGTTSNGPVPPTPADPTPRPGPGPCQLPPYPCTQMLVEESEHLQELAEWVETTIQQCRDLLDEAIRQGITEVTFRTGQLPFVQEETTTTKAGAAEAPPR